MSSVEENKPFIREVKNFSKSSSGEKKYRRSKAEFNKTRKKLDKIRKNPKWSQINTLKSNGDQVATSIKLNEELNYDNTYGVYNNKDGYIDERSSQTSASNTAKFVPLLNETYNLNNKFQEITQQLFKISEIEHTNRKIDLNKKFYEVSKDFLLNAKTYGKVIIREASSNEKSIKPLDDGETYIVRNIFFKFAKNGKDHYKSAKIAAHELKSLAYLYNCHIHDLHLPLQCIIDYMGFRLVATLCLPIDSIGNSTIKHGSVDGIEVKQDKVFLKYFEEIEKKFNLDLNDHPSLQGHEGSDKRNYIYNLSQTFPPCVEGDKPSDYKRFRPESLITFKVYNQKIGCNDVAILSEITDNLTLHVINNFALKFGKRCEEIINPFGYPGIEIIGRILHQEGINLRYMGKLLNEVKSDKAKIFLTVEIQARAIKNLIRQIMRDIFVKSKILETTFIRTVTDILNVAFEKGGQPSEEQNKFRSLLKPYLLNFCVSDGFDFDKIVGEIKLVDGTVEELLILRVCNLLCLKFKKSTMCATKLFNSDLKNQLPFIIKSVGHKVKHMNIISHAEAYILKQKGFYHPALLKFEEALNSTILNKYSLRNTATCALEYLKTLVDDRSSNINYLKKYIIYLMKSAKKLDSDDTNTFYQFGELLFQMDENHEDMEKYFLDALELNAYQYFVVGQYLKKFYEEYGIEGELRYFNETLEELEKKKPQDIPSQNFSI